MLGHRKVTQAHMTTYKEYLALLESPVYSPDESRSHLDQTVSGVKNRIQSLHNTAKDLGNGYYHADVGDGEHLFYKHDGNRVTAFSNIVDGVQELLYKDIDVPKSVPVDLVNHALKTIGPVTSDATHTKGSKSFWFNVHDNFPGHRIEAMNLNNEKSFDITKKQLQFNQDKLWGDDSYAANLRFRIHPKE